MMELARRPTDPRPIRLAEITDKHRIPQRFLVQIMLQMKAAGLVHTTRGASGGYHLAKPPEQITLADIFGVLDCLDEAEVRKAGDRELGKRLQDVWRRLAKARTHLLQQITLRDLVPSEVAPDYII
jgi:Rrf2 family cysteine metabolism transcriptional repressor